MKWATWLIEWRFRWYVAGSAIGVAILVLFLPRMVRGYRRRSRYRRGWVSYLVQRERKRLTGYGLNHRLAEWRHDLPRPTLLSFLTILNTLVYAYLFQYLLTPLIGSFLPTRDAISQANGIIGGLLQAHVTVAGVALPILIFFMQRAKEEEETRLPASELMTLESWAFPVSVFAFLGAIKMSLDFSLLPGSLSALLVDVGIFTLTVLLTVRVVFRTLKLSFSRAELREKGLLLIREKATMSAEHSVLARLAENILLREARHLRVGFWPFGVGPAEHEQFFVLESHGQVRVTDVNLSGLREFIDELRFKPGVATAGPIPPAQAAGGEEIQSSSAAEEIEIGSSTETIFLGRLIGQMVDELPTALLLVAKQSVESFEGVNGEHWIRRIFRLER